MTAAEREYLKAAVSRRRKEELARLIRENARKDRKLAAQEDDYRALMERSA